MGEESGKGQLVGRKVWTIVLRIRIRKNRIILPDPDPKYFPRIQKFLKIAELNEIFKKLFVKIFKQSFKFFSILLTISKIRIRIGIQIRTKSFWSIRHVDKIILEQILLT